MRRALQFRALNRSPAGDDRPKEIQELMRPPETLHFTQDGTAIKMTGDCDRHQTFYTDGREIKKSKDAENQEFDATWQTIGWCWISKGRTGTKSNARSKRWKETSSCA